MVTDPFYWALLPVGILIALAYTSTGISGANFWVPVFLLGLGLDPRTAFWLALVTMLFGSASGLFRHWRMGTIDVPFAARLAALGAPAAVVGSLAAPALPIGWLAAGFGVFALVYGFALLRGAAGASSAPEVGDRIAPIWPLAGGLMTGLISVGMGALLLPRVLASRHFRHHARAVGTSVLAVFVTSLAAALARLRGGFLEQLEASAPELLGVMVFVIPAVLVGGQVGPRLAHRLERRTMSGYGGTLLIAIGLLMLVRAVFGV